MMCGLGASGNPAAADRARQGVHVPVHPAEEGGGHHPFDQRAHRQFSFSSGASRGRADKHRACLDALSEGMSTGQSYQSWQIVIRVIR